MGIYVPGVAKSDNCYECPCKKWVDDGCAGCWADSKIHNASRPVDCPLVEIPEPHGDLIDRDALEADICPEWNGLYVPDNAYSEKLIYTAPTVIAREDGEKHDD